MEKKQEAGAKTASAKSANAANAATATATKAAAAQIAAAAQAEKAAKLEELKAKVIVNYQPKTQPQPAQEAKPEQAKPAEAAPAAAPAPAQEAPQTTKNAELAQFAQILQGTAPAAAAAPAAPAPAQPTKKESIEELQKRVNAELERLNNKKELATKRETFIMISEKVKECLLKVKGAEDFETKICRISFETLENEYSRETFKSFLCISNKSLVVRFCEALQEEIKTRVADLETELLKD